MKILLISSLFLVNHAFASSYIVEFSKKLNEKKIKQMEIASKGELKGFTKSSSDYFKRTYKLKTNLKEKELKLIFKHYKTFKKLEQTVSIKSSSVVESSKKSELGNDPLLSFQWGLDYIDQKVINEISDIENVIIKGNSQSDIEVGDLDKVSKIMKRDAVVAVIDTGVDFDHPDLKDNIYKNEIECENGEIPFKPERSLDENKFPGDCKGWDFTGRGELGSNRPTDYVGHGTHIAGIISGVRNNGIGISGLSNKIKILPIKVLSNKKEDSQALGTSDRLAEAILYATQMKVDVINLSLGWPISFDKDHLRNAVLHAIENNITVVAAAGNNDHSEPIFPCSYENVICVGSIDPNSKFSDFSNYGGHVDVLAPGNNILSTYPTANTPMFFDLEGFEIKSGTSQAAPYVSALAAVIKAAVPNISEDELKAKIFGSTGGPASKGAKYSSGSKINFDRAIEQKLQSVLKPDFKNLSRIKVDLNTKEFEFDLKIKNYGAKTNAAKVDLYSNSVITFAKRSFNLGQMYSGQSKRIKVRGKVSSIDEHFFQTLKLDLTYNGNTYKYTNELRLFVDFNDNLAIKRFPINNAIPDEVLGLNTINLNHSKETTPAYYATKVSKDEGIIFSLFEMKNNNIEKVGMTLLKDISQVISVHRLDMNQDGKADYMIRSVVNLDGEEEGADKTQTIQYAYFNSSLKPLFTKNGKNLSNWNLKFEKVILQDLDDFSLVPVTNKEFGKILIPVFHAHAKKPEADTNDNPFARLRGRVFSTKLFYYLPQVNEDGEVSLITRTFNTNKFIDDFKRRLNVKPFEQVYVLKMFKQSLAEIKSGTIKLLITHEPKSGSAKNYIMTIEDLEAKIWRVEKLLGDQNVNLASFAIDRGINLDADKPSNHFQNLNIVASEKLSPTVWEQVIIKSGTPHVGVQTVVQKDKLDPVQIPIKTYFGEDAIYRFFQTPSRIFMHLSENGMEKTTSMPVHVSSFLPGILFQEQHYPIVIGENKKYPALYVDSTQIASRNIYTIIAKGDVLKAPMSLNVNVPKKCITKNPQVIGGQYHYSLLCLKDGGAGEMIYFPVSEQEAL